MNELYILGELMHEPMHGYLMQTILNRIIGPTRQISWGVLYPLIHNLLAEGMIEQAPDEQPESAPQGRGRKKKTYRITGDGKRRFFRLMEEPIPYSPDYDLHFYIKLSNFHMIPKELQLLILHQYKDYLRFELRHAEEQLKEVGSTEGIPDGERQFIVAGFQHRLAKIRFDEEWALQLINNHRTDAGGMDRE